MGRQAASRALSSAVSLPLRALSLHPRYGGPSPKNPLNDQAIPAGRGARKAPRRLLHYTPARVQEPPRVLDRRGGHLVRRPNTTWTQGLFLHPRVVNDYRINVSTSYPAPIKITSDGVGPDACPRSPLPKSAASASTGTCPSQTSVATPESTSPRTLASSRGTHPPSSTPCSGSPTRSACRLPNS